MTIGIKTRNFSPTKTEKTFEQDGLGWAPGYEKKFEGMATPASIKKYRDNYDKIDWGDKGCSG